MFITATGYLRYEVPEADCGHGNEDEVERLKEAPTFPNVEHSGPTNNVDE